MLSVSEKEEPLDLHDAEEVYLSDLEMSPEPNNRPHFVL